VVRRLLICFAIGAVVGTFLDAVHAYGGVLSYPDPVLGRLAFFVPLEFGLLGVLAGALVPTLERVAGGRCAFGVGERLSELALFSAIYVATTLVHGGWSFALAIALAGLAVGRLLRGSAPGDWLYVLVAAILGPASEALMSALGAFEYNDLDVLGIPIWLPALWANGGFLIRRLIAPVVMPSGAPAREQARIVGDDSGDAELAERLDPAAVVHGPDI
jgi:Protein of unknown function (DUF2878)